MGWDGMGWGAGNIRCETCERGEKGLGSLDGLGEGWGCVVESGDAEGVSA